MESQGKNILWCVDGNPVAHKSRNRVVKLARSSFWLRGMVITLLQLALSCSFCMLCALASATNSPPDVQFIVGPRNPEDLVGLGGGRWIIASGMVAGESLKLIDAKTKQWLPLGNAGPMTARQDMRRYAACPGPPVGDKFFSHGLSLREQSPGHALLHVVMHGEREAIEIYDIDYRKDPQFTWIGCVLLPPGLKGNAVAALKDGGFLVTITLNPGKNPIQMFSGESTGDVWEWSPKDGFRRIPGGELAGDNGVEVSADETEIYVAATGSHSVVKFARNGDVSLRVVVPVPFTPDNLRWAPDHTLLVAGQADEPACGGAQRPENLFQKCARGIAVAKLNTSTMQVRMLIHVAAREDFDRVSSALQIGDVFWIGSWQSDRIAYFQLPESIN
jgi:hypothetical protein